MTLTIYPGQTFSYYALTIKTCKGIGCSRQNCLDSHGLRRGVALILIATSGFAKTTWHRPADYMQVDGSKECSASVNRLMAYPGTLFTPFQSSWNGIIFVGSTFVRASACPSRNLWLCTANKWLELEVPIFAHVWKLTRCVGSWFLSESSTSLTFIFKARHSLGYIEKSICEYLANGNR